jgi:hypothetical protein
LIDAVHGQHDQGRRAVDGQTGIGWTGAASLAKRRDSSGSRPGQLSDVAGGSDAGSGRRVCCRCRLTLPPKRWLASDVVDRGRRRARPVARGVLRASPDRFFVWPDGPEFGLPCGRAAGGTGWPAGQGGRRDRVAGGTGWPAGQGGAGGAGWPAGQAVVRAVGRADSGRGVARASAAVFGRPASRAKSGGVLAVVVGGGVSGDLWRAGFAAGQRRHAGGQGSRGSGATVLNGRLLERGTMARSAIRNHVRSRPFTAWGFTRRGRWCSSVERRGACRVTIVATGAFPAWVLI